MAPRLKRPAGQAEGKGLRDPEISVDRPCTNFPDNWARWANAAGLRREFKPCPVYDLSMNLIFAVKEGVGIAITQPCMIERELRSGELLMPFALPVSTGRGYFVCIDRDRPAAPGQLAFMEWVQDGAKRMTDPA
ncbi:LysR substrate-binding domain-containing protein [Acidovorax sp.]|uniref:LysR substrate-binding domain-containing protein n=1 Tax=Acidovorax sp. TaxID=1872122 RepID=UPI00391EF788